MLTSAQNSFSDYNDVQQVLAFSTDLLPPVLNSSDLSARRQAWPEWVIGRDHDIRKRLERGDEDAIVNWLLFGTSFTQQPRALFEVPATSDGLPRLISRRIRDFISALESADSNERSVFARRLLRSQGYGFDTIQGRARLERHLQAEVERVLAERQEYALREEGFAPGDVIGQIMVESTLFRDRGLSLDTSILSSFAIEQALETMRNQRLLPPNGIRRVAVIGPGLDFADKNSGYDFYPVQTVQPFTSIDSLVRLGLAAGPDEIELTTFDISPRVNDHILAIRDRAKTGAPYVLRLPADLGSQWTPALVSYWKSIGDRIGSETPLPKPPDIVKGIELRGIEVRFQVAARITPVDFNVVTQKWTGPPFDLVIATNVFVYYDRLDQSLAFAGIEAMLRPGGFFITNNVIVESPASRLRSVGIITVQHSAQKIDHVFWYRRDGQ
ncbi:MAG: class I SAM-dependent methyltransferase [Acidobacteria bacterium]|nr:class I SAM-dependent methyltransferase [Acidobacteriota bacterium]